MPSLSAEDRLTAKAIDEWIITAREEIDDIGGWRDAESSDRYHRYWSGIRPGRDTVCGETMPGRFFGDTVHLVGWIVSRFPKLDPTPLQDVYGYVLTWHEDHNADGIPPQSTLVRNLDQAALVLNIVRNDIITRQIPDRTAETADDLGTTVTGDPGRSTKDTKPRRRPKRTKADILRDEGNIAAYLAEHPDAKRDEVADAAGIAGGHVSASKAWTARQAQKKEARKANRARGIGGVGDDDDHD